MFIFQLPATSRFRSGIYPSAPAPRRARPRLRPRRRTVYVRTTSARSHRDRRGSTDRRRRSPATASVCDMMQAIRGKAGSIVVKILFGLLIISFGLWGISDYLFRIRGTRRKPWSPRSATRRSRPTNCSARCSRRWSGCGRSSAAPSISSCSSSSASSTTCSNQLIDRGLLDQEAQRLGLEVSDDVIRNAIYENPAFRGPDGRFDRRLFAQVLMMNRLSEDQLVARMRQEHPARRSAAGGHRRGRAAAPGGRGALPVSQRKAGRRHRRRSRSPRSPISASRARPS